MLILAEDVDILLLRDAGIIYSRKTLDNNSEDLDVNLTHLLSTKMSKE